MAHTIREKTKLLGRVRRIRGQVEGLERLLEEEQGCAAVMQQIAAVRGAVNGLMAEVIEDHLLAHVVNVAQQGHAEAQAARAEGAAELVEVIRTYLR